MEKLEAIDLTSLTGDDGDGETLGDLDSLVEAEEAKTEGFSEEEQLAKRFERIEAEKKEVKSRAKRRCASLQAALHQAITAIELHKE